MNPEKGPAAFRPQSPNNPISGEKINGPEELPDYAEEEVVAPLHASSAGLSNPKNWTRLTVCLLLLIGLVLLSPLYHSLKNWRSSVLLDRAQTAFAYGDNDLGLSLLKQAMALSPGNEPVGREVELFNARMGDPVSLKKLIDRMTNGQSSVDELLGIAEIGGKNSRKELVIESVDKLPKNLTGHQLLRLTLIQALLKNLEQGPSAAAAICLDSSRVMRGDDSIHLQTQAALYLLSDTSEERQKEGLKILMQVMRKKSNVSLQAARILARLSLLSPDKQIRAGISNKELIEVSQLLPTLPGHQLTDELLSADLAIKVEPAGRDDLIKRMSANYQHASRSGMLDFARWLNGRRLYDSVIEFAGPDRPQSDTDWLLIVLDAECAKGDWAKIPDMLDSPAGLGIPDAVKHLFLARVAMMTGHSSTAEDEWRSVKGSLHLEKPETLAYIAGYEEQIGAVDQAMDTYREMADRSESHLPGLIGLIRLQSLTADPATLIPLYEELVAAAPDYSDAASDLAYLRLLNNRDLQQASASAEKLLNYQPDSLARISVAALGRLKNGDPSGAVVLYEGKQINWATAPDRWKAIYVAVLRASGENEAADRLSSSINPSALNPQETTLLSYPVPPTARKKQ